LVCTAGFREDGSWVRIYPVPFRQLSYAEQYQKYQGVEVDLEKNTRDFRPESFKPKNIEIPLTLLDKIPADGEAWHERRKIVLQKKYFDDFTLTKDLYFFLGTTLQFHSVAHNPFIIIGTFHPKPIGQMQLF